MLRRPKDKAEKRAASQQHAKQRKRSILPAQTKKKTHGYFKGWPQQNTSNNYK